MKFLNFITNKWFKRIFPLIIFLLVAVITTHELSVVSGEEIDIYTISNVMAGFSTVLWIFSIVADMNVKK